MRTTQPIVIDLQGCARCGGDGHRTLTFEPLTIVHRCSDDEVMTHWAPCPTNGEPILMGFTVTQ